MRGAPLHLCHRKHPIIAYTGEACPFCTTLANAQRLLQENEALKQALAATQRRLKEAALAAPKETT